MTPDWGGFAARSICQQGRTRSGSSMLYMKPSDGELSSREAKGYQLKDTI
jgi:hypothetical protein